MLRAVGVGVGDEVVVPAFGNVEVAAAVTPRTAAIVVVHRFGRRADVPLLHALGQRHQLLVLERSESEAPYDEMVQRRERSAYLDGRLKGVRTPDCGDGHTCQQCVVRVPGNGRPDRDAFARALRAKGVDCRVPVKTPAHRLPEFRRYVSLPQTERAADETLGLPVDARLTKREMQRIASTGNVLGGLLQPAF